MNGRLEPQWVGVIVALLLKPDRSVGVTILIRGHPWLNIDIPRGTGRDPLLRAPAAGWEVAGPLMGQDILLFDIEFEAGSGP